MSPSDPNFFAKPSSSSVSPLKNLMFSIRFTSPPFKWENFSLVSSSKPPLKKYTLVLSISLRYLKIGIKDKGANLGIDKFGESAPYQEVYKHFKLSEEDITNFVQKKLRE